MNCCLQSSHNKTVTLQLSPFCCFYSGQNPRGTTLKSGVPQTQKGEQSDLLVGKGVDVPSIISQDERF